MSTTSPSKPKRITSAVDFLRDVHGKGYSDHILKKYLMEKRHLTPNEVDRAFLISKNRFKAEKKRNRQNKQLGRDLERPEKSTSSSSNDKFQDLSFLVLNMQAEGKKLINKFLDQEEAYCHILSCLTKEWYVHLRRHADESKIQMSRKEVEEIFLHVPEFLKFHNRFLTDLRQGFNIGRMFVKLFKFFEGYAEYMKDCQQTVYKFRKYIQDNGLNSCLVKICQQSTRPNDDLVDLLLTPLERMLEYRDFLNMLYSWTDRKQTNDYELLGKASRRIGRVSAHIEKYKYGICNQNEMNKVQKLLKDQCEILAPERAIVRRGMMTKRSGWRNKHYVFFLFNDMLLWTNKDGILQNAFQLRSCEVMPSSAKNYAHRKFEVVYKGEKHKTLRLECVKVIERNDWYEAIKRTITTAKLKYNQAWSVSETIINGNYKENSDSFSEEVNVASEGRHFKREDEGNQQAESSEQIEDLFYKRYSRTSSFRNQQFKEIEPMDDNLSQISEQDVFHQDRRKHLPENMIPSSSCLSPFDEVCQKNDQGSGISLVITESSSCHSMSGSVVLVRTKNPPEEKKAEIKEEGFEFFDRHRCRKSIIIRKSKNGVATEIPRTNSPQFKYYLDDF